MVQKGGMKWGPGRYVEGPRNTTQTESC